MKAEFIELESGKYVEIDEISELLIGSKFYWLMFDKFEPQKMLTSKFKLISVGV